MRRHTCLTIATSLLLCAPVMAGVNLDWGVISTAGDPDPVTAFDLNSPGASNTLLGHVDGNFNRGMDFYDEFQFYYFVSTDSLNQPGDRGLWRWDNNVNTQLFNIPFSDSGDGDATLSNDLTRFFVTVDDQDGTSGDSLYVFDNLNGAVTFTEIGETGLSQLIGIAMDPVSGLLYGYDSGTESLYTLSTTDGTPTLVAASGQSFGSIGSMDFNADGSTLLLTIAGDLYKVNKNTAQVEAAGDVGLNVSALSYRIPEPGTALLLGLGVLALIRRR